jgi:predicted secreted protein
MTIGGVGIGSAIAIYFIIWWLTLFVVLPFGVRSQHEAGSVSKGSDPGAPALPNIGRKLVATTLLAALFFGLFLAILNSGLSLDDLPGPKVGSPPA